MPGARGGPILFPLGHKAGAGQHGAPPFLGAGLLPASAIQTITLSLAIASSTETSSDATLIERIVAAIGSSTEDASAGTLVERLSLVIASASEDSSSAALIERLNAAIASSSEDYSDAALVERITAIIATATEDYSDATATIPPPTISLAIDSTTETSSDAAVTIPSATTPDLSPGGGGRREWDDVLERKKKPKREPIIYAPLDARTRREYFPESTNAPAIPAATPVAPAVTPEVPAFVAAALPLPYEPEPVTAFDPTARESDDQMLAVFAAVLFAEEEF